MATSRLSTLLGGIFLYLGLSHQVNATPGRVGCFYDLQLCEQNELCFNDSLFGTCVAQLSDAINYSDLEPAALGEAAQVLQYLIETGYKWQDSYTQCVVGKFLQSAVTHQRYDPDVCEYLKALLDVIDQNKGGLDQTPVAAVAPEGSDLSAMRSAMAEPSVAHGEFMSQSDMATDFDEQPQQQQQQPLPVEPMMPVQNQASQDPNTFDIQQYLQAYQQALSQQQQPSDLVSSAVAQKKSDPVVVVVGDDATPGTTTTSAPTTTTTTTASSVVPADTLLSQLNSTADELDNIEAMRSLMSLISSYPPAASSDDQSVSQAESAILFGSAPDPVSEDQQMTIGIPFPAAEVSPDVMRQIMQQQQSQAPPQNFPLSGPYVQDIYVPDFSAIPPPEILQDMFVRSARAQLQSSPQITPAELMLAQELFGPPPMNQNGLDVSMVDPRLMDPRMQMLDPRMMMDLSMQMQLNPSMMMDPRMQMQPDSWMMMDPRMQMQLDPRMMMDPRMQMQPDPRMMMDPRMQMQPDPRMMMDPRMQMQLDPRMMMDPRLQMDPRMQLDPQTMMDPRMQLDPRMMMDPSMQFDPRLMMDPTMQMDQSQQLDPRAMYGPGFGMNQNLMSSPPFMVDRRMDPFMGPPMGMGMPMKRGGSDFMSQLPPNYGGMPYMQGFGQPMMDPRLQSMYAPAPYGFFPQNVALPFTQPEWRPPMSLPDGYVFAEQGFPVIEASVNESADVGTGDQQIMRELMGETEEPSANGASGPTSPNKKDQEYRSLLPSDESQDRSVEDVTVTVVKGNADKPIPSGEMTGTVVGDADEDTNALDDDYVFLITQPQLEADQANTFVNWLAAVMNLPPQTFYDVNVIDDLLTFRVNPAMEKLNATYVAQTLGGDDLRTALDRSDLYNLAVLRAGVGRYTLDNSAGADVPQLRFLQTAVVQSESAAAAEAQIADKYDVLDPTSAFVVTEPALTYDKARRMLIMLAKELKVPPAIFSSLRIEGNELLFHVTPFYGQINASGVVSRLSDANIQKLLRDEFQVEIIRSGIGDRVQIIKADARQRQTLLIGLIAVACVAAILISLGIIYLIRRNMLMRKKLHGLGGDVESSKEYEELCRQRMASKNIESILSGTPDHKAHDRTNHSSTSSWSEEPAPTNMDITTGHMVLSYMEDHLKHKERMNEEWASLCTYEADPSKSDAGSKLENLMKNRYPDVLPYDHTRVHLNPEANYTKSDYVNANLITDADPKNASYIATQGPLPDTVSDFWQMVWESNSTVIVMLTKLRENDQDLCHVYWPKEGSECYNIFEVHLVSEHIWCDDYLVRNFYLKNLQTHETRTVTQFHYLNWPNLGVPSSLKTFLEFRRKINKCYKGGSSPIVVHCSDGVDRTGAYCLIDLVLNRMAKGVKEIDIAATLEHLRDQRMDMVRTKEQFEFVLTAVAQEIQAILKSMPQK